MLAATCVNWCVTLSLHGVSRRDLSLAPHNAQRVHELNSGTSRSTSDLPCVCVTYKNSCSESDPDAWVGQKGILRRPRAIS